MLGGMAAPGLLFAFACAMFVRVGTCATALLFACTYFRCISCLFALFPGCCYAEAMPWYSLVCNVWVGCLVLLQRQMNHTHAYCLTATSLQLSITDSPALLQQGDTGR